MSAIKLATQVYKNCHGCLLTVTGRVNFAKNFEFYWSANDSFSIFFLFCLSIFNIDELWEFSTLYCWMPSKVDGLMFWKHH